MAPRIPLARERLRRRRTDSAPVAPAARAAHERPHGDRPRAGQRAGAAAVPAQRAAPLVHAHGGHHPRLHGRLVRRAAALRHRLRRAPGRVAARRRARRRGYRRRAAGVRALASGRARLRADLESRRRRLPPRGEQVRLLALGRAALDRHVGLLRGRQPRRGDRPAAGGPDRVAVRPGGRLAARHPRPGDRRRAARRSRRAERRDRVRARRDGAWRARSLGTDGAAAGRARGARLRALRPAHVHPAARARLATQQPRLRLARARADALLRARSARSSPARWPTATAAVAC